MKLNETSVAKNEIKIKVEINSEDGVQREK